jgi:hypothetical protein
VVRAQGIHRHLLQDGAGPSTSRFLHSPLASFTRSRTHSLQDKGARGKIKLKKARVYVTTRHTGKVYGGTHAHATALNNVSARPGEREAY